MAMLTMPEQPKAAEAPPAEQGDFARAAKEQCEYQRSRADRLQEKLNTITDNIRRAELKVDWFLAPPPAANPLPEETEWKECRTVDGAEKGKILEEIMAIERTIATTEAEFAGLKSEHKAEIEGHIGKIKGLKEAAESNSRTVVIPARKERDWSLGVLRIVAKDDGRVLDEKPLPKGEQRTIPGTEAPAAQESVPPTAAPVPDVQAANGATAKPEPIEAEGSVSTARGPGPPGRDGLIFDSIFHEDAYRALKLANRLVTKEELPDVLKAYKGRVVGPSAAAKIEDSIEQLVADGHIVKENGGYRVLGAPSAQASQKAPKDRVLDVIRVEPTTLEAIAQKTGIPSEGVKTILKDIDKTTKLATSGKARGTKYSLPMGSAPGQAQA